MHVNFVSGVAHLLTLSQPFFTLIFGIDVPPNFLHSTTYQK